MLGPPSSLIFTFVIILCILLAFTKSKPKKFIRYDLDHLSLSESMCKETIIYLFNIVNKKCTVVDLSKCDNAWMNRNENRKTCSIYARCGPRGREYAYNVTHDEPGVAISADMARCKTLIKLINKAKI